MKKQFVLSGLVAAACIAYASTEKIRLIKDGSVLNSVRVEKIDHIGYSGDGEGYNTIDIYTLDGDKTSVSLDEVDHIEYVAPLPANPLSVEVEPHHMCATLHITVSDPDAWYRVAGVPTRMLDGVDQAEWADIIAAADIRLVKSIAESYGRPLSSFPMSSIFHQGELTRDWFPDVVIDANTPISLVAYTAVLNGEEVEITTEPLLINFTTKEIVDLGVKFDLTADLTSNAITVKADAQDSSDIPFVIELYSPADVEANGLPALMRSSLQNLEGLVYNYGKTWDDVTFRGHGEKSWANLRLGERWVAVAFGCEYGVATTQPSVATFTVPSPVVTDECVFEVTAEQLSPSEMALSVVPSSTDTRYAAFLVDGDNLGDPAEWVANKIYWINTMNTFQWDTTDFIHTGEAVLSTHDDMIGGVYLKAGHEYYVLICGIDKSGTRTTEIKSVKCVTSAQVTEGLKFEVSFSDFDGSSQWSHSLTANVVPSDKDAKYVVISLPATNAYVNLDCTDEEFISRYVEVQGQYLDLYSGDLSKRLSFSSSWSTGEFEPYIFAVFGYDGAATTPLYAYSVNTATGEATQVRGPAEEAALTFDISASDFDGANKWTHYLTVNILPSDKEAKYVVISNPATNAYVNLDCTDQEFIDRYVEVQGQYLVLNSGDLAKRLAFSPSWSTNEFEPYILAVFGYDGAATSPVYAFSVNTATGELTQVRGPGME